MGALQGPEQCVAELELLGVVICIAKAGAKLLGRLWALLFVDGRILAFRFNKIFSVIQS